MKCTLIGLCLAGLFFPAIFAKEASVKRGALVLFGGGQAPAEGMIEALALCDADSPKVLVIPAGSSEESSSIEASRMWRELGVEVSFLEPLDRPDAHGLLEACDLIWIPDGSERELMNRLAKQGLVLSLIHI